MRIKSVLIGTALLGVLTLGALAFGVANARADQTFKSGLYQNQPYSCADGSRIDPSGQSFGTFQVTETHNYPSQLVRAYISVDNLRPNLWYQVSVTEYGPYCITGVGAFPGNQPIWMYVGPNKHGSVSFSFWAHTGERSAWVTVQHGNVMTVRSMALPINR